MNAELTELNRIDVIRNEHEHEHGNADMFWLILCDSHPLLGCSQISRGSLTTRIAISRSVIFIIVGIFRNGENSLWKLATMRLVPSSEVFNEEIRGHHRGQES